jgi:hypothetical protein
VSEASNVMVGMASFSRHSHVILYREGGTEIGSVAVLKLSIVMFACGTRKKLQHQ